ncbi:MAG: ABC transporter ATP-binding protein [Aeromonas sp.]
MSSAAPLLQLSGIERAFMLGGSEVRALHDLSLTVHSGEYLAVMGPSGSGKSTLLNLIGLLDRPDRGQYLFAGTPTPSLDETALAALRGQRIGFVFQSFHLINRLSARENIELPLMLAGIAPKVRRARSSELLGELGLSNRAEHTPSELSGGQRQRVAIARALAMAPPLLLADEPTGNLDSKSGEEVIALLERVNRERGITLLVVTHDARLGERAARRIWMRDGAIEEDSARAMGMPHA